MAPELIRRERRKGYVRTAIRSSSSSLRQLSRGTGYDESSVRHWASGRVEQSPWWREAEGLRRLVAGRKTNPAPMLAELEALILEAHYELKETDELVRLLFAALDAEHDDEARENRATQQKDIDAMIDALTAEAHRQLAIAAMLRVLKDKGVDPFRDRN